MENKIHRARLEDVCKIAPLFDQYRQFYKVTSDLLGAKNFLHQRLQAKESVIFYAESDDPAKPWVHNSVLGFVQLYPCFSSLSLRPLWILNDLFVLSVARKFGLGKSLMLTACDFAKSNGARGLQLKTAVDNVPAQALYESLGWVKNDRFYSYEYLF